MLRCWPCCRCRHARPIASHATLRDSMCRRCRHARPIASHATLRDSMCRRCRHARPIASHATLRVPLCHRCRHSRTAPHGSYLAPTLNGNNTHSICTVDWVGHAPALWTVVPKSAVQRAKRVLEFTWSTCLGDEWRESYWIVCVHVSEYMAMRLLRISSHIYVQSTARITQQTLRGIPPR